MKTGVIIIAIGDNFYKQLAYNLALSLRQADAFVEIALLSDSLEVAELLPDQKKVFDSIIKIDEKEYYDEQAMKHNPFMLKTKIYRLSPFDNTLFLDADQLFLHEGKSLRELLEKLSSYDFQMHEVSRYTKKSAHQSGMIWTKRGEDQNFPKLFDFYGLEEDTIYPETNSSFIWFKKNEANKKYFDLVEKNYFNRPEGLWTSIGTHYPDEMAWNISSAQLKHYSAISGWKPCYLNWENARTTLAEVETKYYFLNMASGYQPSDQLAWYNNLVKRMRIMSGDRFPFDFEMRKKVFFNK